MRVLLIPEDFRKDQYILKPIFERLFSDLGRPSARVRVCQDPLLGGDGEALKSERMAKIVEEYPMVDIFILCVDRDGRLGRRQRLDHIEQEIEQEFRPARTFLAENAWQEIETWVLAGIALPNELSWADVRAEVQVKELYFDPYVAQRGLADTPGGGRKPLGEEASRHINTIRQKCPEDFDSLALRLETIV